MAQSPGRKGKTGRMKADATAPLNIKNSTTLSHTRTKWGHSAYLSDNALPQ